MLKQKTFNYITLILAIFTIFMAISIVENNTSKWPCIVMLVITLFFSFLSRKYNDELLNMKKGDKENLEKIINEIKSNDSKNISKKSNKK